MRRTLHGQHDELYIEIQEGQLLPYGVINASTVVWKHPQSESFRKNFNDPYLVFSDNERFYLFAQDLSDFNHAGLPMVLTGLQFQSEGHGVSLKIHGSKVSFNASDLNVLVSKPFSPNYYVSPISPKDRQDDNHHTRFIRDNENPDDKLKVFTSKIDHG